MENIAFLFGAAFWVMGIVLAKGFWLVVLAVTMPPYAWYLVAEMLMQKFGWLA